MGSGFLRWSLAGKARIAMRRLLVSLFAAGLLGTLAGCHCVVGKCDCVPDVNCTQCPGSADSAGCAGAPAATPVVPNGNGPANAEKIPAPK